MTDNEMKEPGDCCCPPFDPKPYEEQEITWTNKPFIQEWTYCVNHIPLNFGGAVLRGMDKLKKAGYAHNSANLILSDCHNPFRTNIFLPVVVDTEPTSNDGTASEDDIKANSEESVVTVPNAEMFHLSGTFLTKVFEGPYTNYCQFLTEMTTYVKERRPELKEPLSVYNFYPTCPKCSNKYGKNYVVIFAQVAE